MHAPRNRAPRPALMAALLAATLAACGGDDGPGPTDQSGRLEGQVVIAGTEAGAGPLVGATVTISQIDENSPTGAVRTVAGTVTTDAGGRYGLDVGLLNGLFLVEAAGGSYVEPASGETIALDAAASIRTLHHLPLLAVRTDALVSPVGHLTHALAQALLDAGQAGADARLDDAHAVASTHLDAHFGNVHWEAVVPANPGVPAPSPTEPVRAAFVLAGWPILAADLAERASASVQGGEQLHVDERLGRGSGGGAVPDPAAGSRPGRRLRWQRRKRPRWRPAGRGMPSRGPSLPDQPDRMPARDLPGPV